MDELLTFDSAIADSAGPGKRHLLLGNGFSIGCRAEIFHYASLFGEADFSHVPEVKSVFVMLDRYRVVPSCLFLSHDLHAKTAINYKHESTTRYSEALNRRSH